MSHLQYFTVMLSAFNKQSKMLIMQIQNDSGLLGITEVMKYYE